MSIWIFVALKTMTTLFFGFVREDLIALVIFYSNTNRISNLEKNVFFLKILLDAYLWTYGFEKKIKKFEDMSRRLIMKCQFNLGFRQKDDLIFFLRNCTRKNVYDIE